MTVNETINGLPIVATLIVQWGNCYRAGRYVVFPDSTDEDGRFSVAFQGHTGGWEPYWSGRQHFDTLDDAMRELSYRATKRKILPAEWAEK